MALQIKLTILAENRVSHAGLLAEQGLSIFIETLQGNILFDTGQSDAFLRNAKELKKDLSSLKGIVLSHGHYDHTGGLPHYLETYGQTDVYCHPALSNKKYKVYPGGRLDIGVPWEESKIKQQGANCIYKSHPYEILPGIWLSGEIPRNTAYEQIDEQYQQRVAESYIHDELHDDQFISIVTNKGLVVLLGCGHAGVINSVKHAMRITGTTNVYAVLGGMHLLHAPEERIRKIVHNLERLNPQYIVPLHCTGFNAIHHMYNRFKERVILMNVGSVFEVA